jgi:hypothetical protein
MAVGWTHRACEKCYIDQQREEGYVKVPTLVSQAEVDNQANLLQQLGRCCLCGGITVIGLYMRIDPATLSCTHEKGDDF